MKKCLFGKSLVNKKCNTCCTSVFTGNVASIGNESATITDNRFQNAQCENFQAGVQYATNPCFTDSLFVTAPNTSPFFVEINNLSPDTVYYYRAFTTTSQGMCVGSTKTFETLPTTIPVVVTGNVIDITANSATVINNSYSDVSASVSATGIEYSIVPTFSPSQTILSQVISNPFSVDLNGLTSNTAYFYRAFIQSAGDTFKGSIKSFITSDI